MPPLSPLESYFPWIARGTHSLSAKALEKALKRRTGCASSEQLVKGPLSSSPVSFGPQKGPELSYASARASVGTKCRVARPASPMPWRKIQWAAVAQMSLHSPDFQAS